MIVDNKKIAYICCTNDPIYFDECRRYLEQLVVPEGISTELIPVRDAPSMCTGYNRGMRMTDAKYKIYLHQDVFIINPYFLENLLQLFADYPEAGLIGMVGSLRLPDIAVMWTGKRTGSSSYTGEVEFEHERIDKNHPVFEVSCVDGFLMATQIDIPWREDLFDGWDFYDVSHSFEFRRHGYQVIVPVQNGTWCVHGDGLVMSLFRYDHYREIFLHEYREEIDRYAVIPRESDETENKRRETEYLAGLKKQTAESESIRAEIAQSLTIADDCLYRSDIAALVELDKSLSIDPGYSAAQCSAELLNLSRISKAVRLEEEHNLPNFINGVTDSAGLCVKILRTVFALRRIEYALPGADEGLIWLREEKISAYSVAALLYGQNSLLGHRQKILLNIVEDAIRAGELMRAYLHLAVIQNPSEEIEELKNNLWEVMNS